MNSYSTVTSSSSKYFTREVPTNTDDEIIAYNYISAISPRGATAANKTTNARVGASSVFSSVSSSNLGTVAKPTNPGILAITETREKEKRELGFLNDKFASYVERVRFLEVHNKKLQLELEALKNRSGGDATKVKEMFEIELREARMLIEQTSKDKAATELRLKAVDEEAERFRRRYAELLNAKNNDNARITELSKQIAENEADINLLKRRLGDLEDTLKRFKAENLRLFGEIHKINAEIEAENLRRVKLENDKAALLEELNYLRIMHKKQLEEISSHSFVEVGIDSSQFFKSELALAIKGIRNEYEAINAAQKADIDNFYRIKIQDIHSKPRAIENTGNLAIQKESERLKLLIAEVRKEIAALKARNAELEIKIKELEESLVVEEREAAMLLKQKDAEIAGLRRRQAELLADLDELTKVKTSLEEEILTYRRLLEGEGNQDGLKQVVEGIEQRAKTFTVIQAAAPAALSTGSTSYAYSYVSSGGSKVADLAASRVANLGSASSSVTVTKVRQYQY